MPGLPGAPLSPGDPPGPGPAGEAADRRSSAEGVHTQKAQEFPSRSGSLAFFAPGLNFDPDRACRYGVSFDDGPVEILDVVPEGFDARNGNREWEESVKNSIRVVRSEHELSAPGYHTLKIWMVDPGVVLEKIVVDLGGVRPSYLGPPESYFRDPGAGSLEEAESR